MNHDQLFVKMAISAWDTYIQRMNRFLDHFADAELEKEVAPGKNRVSYLLGHLVSIHDKLFELLEIGERSHKDLDEPFLKLADRAATSIVPDGAALRGHWKKQNEILSEKFAKMNVADWFTKHSAVSAEDFAKDPSRNKLNVLINRTNHMAYHFGQLQLIKTG